MDHDTAPGTTGGLTVEEASRRLLELGPNRLPDPPRRGVALRVLDQLRDPMILLLLGAAALTAALHDLGNTAIIAMVVVFNTSVGVAQQVRAERAMSALRALTAPTARVERDGVVAEVASEHVVPGDLVHLTAGDVVPADGVLLEAVTLQVNQALVTGEALPVDLDEGDELVGGTSVTRGRASARILRTGADSGVGAIAQMMVRATTRPTPLQRRLTRLSRDLVAVISVLTCVVVASGLWQGRPLTEMLVVGLSLAVAAVPESLPAVVTIALALGARRMARHNAVIRSLPAVETLGSVTVVATDKTGTITEGTMLARHVWVPDGTWAVSGSGYDPRGHLTNAASSSPGLPAPVQRLLRDAALCNDARLVHEDPGWSVVGDPLEGALLVLAAKGGLDLDETRTAWRRTAEEPFDHTTLRMTTRHAGPDGSALTICKGAPEAVLDIVEPGPAVSVARGVAGAFADEGLRVIAVADAGSTDVGRALELVGLVAVGDPPRAHAALVVERLGAAGIRVVLVTGDHPGTASNIARAVGIEEEDVVARVRPEQKVEVVERLQRSGEVVAMIGDGVNDAPALRHADIGVAAGDGGSEVAKQAADLVLMDNDLSTVVAAVQEGRRIFANIRTFLTFALAGGLAEVAVMLLGPVIGLVLPLLPGQILWINLLTHGITGVAFGNEPSAPQDMSTPPRPASEAVLTARSWLLIAVAVLAMTAAAITVGALAPGSVEERRTSIFLTLGLAQLGVALALRAPGARRPFRSRHLELAVLVAALLQLGAVVVPPLQALLGTTVVEPSGLVPLALAAAVPGVLVRLVIGVLGWRRRA
ncbi:cation-translocating P-type ATPase [Nocardioides ganghwensis]|uniref:Cation-transporting P-type ATPase n=1 Tax=Nocardioides ganghwensis TaxID=252230 RepID=A0A4V1RMI2_9ACTN|nr:cation-transporting P-type ATPase [Nocardioides ganghwensis]MBD3947122.1 cation-transporting P-type ATPase [Nocardioides ganghwensis]RYC02021.1 cation-transporting P-type ATPase [Nocardioides ganghwensis]